MVIFLFSIISSEFNFTAFLKTKVLMTKLNAIFGGLGVTRDIINCSIVVVQKLRL